MLRLLGRITAPLTIVFLSLGLTAAPSRADTTRDLYDAMQLSEIIAIMREEGLRYGETLRTEMLGGASGPGWMRAVDRIYSFERMETEFLTGFEGRIDPKHYPTLIQFFSSQQGRDIVHFETSARRALLDEDVEATAKQIYDDLVGELDPRLDLIERYVEANDLIESNVAGALNSSLAFYEGLAKGDALDSALTPDRILALVWDQEPEIRAETKDWIYPFLTLAFDPITESDIEAYIALSESEAGQDLNAALFAAFDVLFVNISRDMGAAVAVYMQGEDI